MTTSDILNQALVISVLLLIVFNPLSTDGVLGHIFWCNIKIFPQSREAFVDKKVVDLFKRFAARFARSACGCIRRWVYTYFLGTVGRQI
jgi:hypothetical protein